MELDILVNYFVYYIIILNYKKLIQNFVYKGVLALDNVVNSTNICNNTCPINKGMYNIKF